MSEAFERVWHLLTYLLFPVSGAMFMADWLPEPMREVVLSLPMVHGVEMLRGAWFGDAVKTHEDPGYLFTCIGILAFTGLALIRVAGRRVEPN
jgi:capsular polysaccharide transport system permease protein